VHGVLPEDYAYFQYGWSTGSRPTPFNKNEVIYIMKNPQPSSIYGRSNVEVLLDVLRMLTYGVEHNLEYFTDNSIPKGVLSLLQANTKDIEAFSGMWQEVMRKKDAGGNWKKIFHKMPIVNSDLKFERVGFSNLELELLEQQKWFTKLVWACFGITPDELGFTEDSNKAVTIGQSAVFKRKAVRPLVQLIEYHFNTQIINDLPWIKGKYEGKVKFCFDKFDLQEELSKRQMYWGDIEKGLRSVNEIREELDLEPLATENIVLEKENSLLGKDVIEEALSVEEAQSEKEVNEEETEENKEESEMKALVSFSSVVPKEFEFVNEEQIKKKIKQNFLEISKAMEKDFDSESKKVINFKAIDKGFIDKIVKAFDVTNLLGVIGEAVRKSYQNAFEKVERQNNMNLLGNKKALDFLENYTFKNIKDLDAEAKNDLRAEIERGIMNNESVSKIKERVMSVLDVSETRANTIARTETYRAINTGELLAWKEAGRNVKKKVVAVIDSKTSDVCKHLNGKEKNLGEKFKYKGEEFEAPPFHVNCRSRLEFVEAKE
jgi:SPP1 gp7 family putative phage head morphogenesis protein